MALSYVDVDGTLIVPSAPVSWTAAPSTSGSSTTGIVVLVGEADNGPSFADEDVTKTSRFGPTSRAQVIAKYGSGRLVEAFLMTAAPSKDPQVKGAPAAVYLIKTNHGVQASFSSGGASVKASAIATIVAAVSGNKVTINGVDFAGVTSGATGNQWNVGSGGSADATSATNLAAAISNSTTPGIAGVVSASPASNVVTVQAVQPGAGGNSITFTAVGSPITVTGSGNLAGGAGYGKLNAKLAGILGNLIQFTTGALSGGALKVTVARKADNISESWTIGGNTVLTLTSTGTTPTVTISTAGQLSSGGSPTTSLGSIKLSQYKTIADLAAYIGTFNGWTATVAAGQGQLSPAAALDCVTNLSVSSPAAIKRDSYDFETALNSSRLVSVDPTYFPTTGLPAQNQNVFLGGGTKGSSTDQNFIDAFTQAARIKANFVVPIVSQDATSDITVGYTDSASTYTIAGVTANLAAHISLCRQFKVRKPRQGFASIRDTYVNAKTGAQAQASFAISMSFLELQMPNASGTATWFQPWSEAVVAAAMQAAAGYKTIFNKALNISGIRAPMNDFIIEDLPSQEDAIQNGLLLMGLRDSDDAVNFVSDQTTYGFDANFVYNSIQAVYTADTLSMTVATQMEAAFKGQNIADISAGVAMSYLKAILGRTKKQKLIVASDDAPTGYKNLQIDLMPPAMLVSGECKPATGIYFIPIKFLLTQPSQTATG